MIMKDFYFTYGSDKQYPFNGGWTKITAPSINTALNLFTAVHPIIDGCLNCADYYTEDEFKKTNMYRNNSNCGFGEHEHITMNIEYPILKKS